MAIEAKANFIEDLRRRLTAERYLVHEGRMRPGKCPMREFPAVYDPS